MSKIMQNLVVLMDPSEESWSDDMKPGNMILNRFCIDEDAAFELSGVNYLKKGSGFRDSWKKGKKFSIFRSDCILRNLICMNN